MNTEEQFEETPFSVPAECVAVATRGNRSLKITFTTDEALADATTSRLITWHGRTAHLLFLSEDPVPGDLAKLPKLTEEDGNKSPATRLNGVLYRLWEQEGRPMSNYQDYYRSIMGRVIDHYKSKLL